MESPNIRELNYLYDNYLSILEYYKCKFNSTNVSNDVITQFIDEIKIFWLKNLEEANLILNLVTKNTYSYLLSGAIYLNIANYEHFQFSLLGNNQILYDPFLKMERLFRYNACTIGTKSASEYFISVFEDTLEILTDLKHKFLIFPIEEILNYGENEKTEIFQNLHLKLLSEIFKYNFCSSEDFYNRYVNFTKLSEDIPNFVLDNLIFLDIDDSKLEIKERLDKYLSYAFPNNEQIKDLTYTQKFYIVTYTFFSQAFNIIITCTELKLIPFVRSNVTLRYLLLISGSFKDDPVVMKVINRSVVSSLFYNLYPNHNFETISFDKFEEISAKVDFIELVINHFELDVIPIYKCHLGPIADYIRENFDKLILEFK